MASKKTTKTKTKAPAKTAKGRKKRDVTVEAVSQEARSATAPESAENTSTPAKPQTAAAAEATPDQSSAPQTAWTTAAELPTPSQKLSAIDAAVKVLDESGQPMSCQEMITAMAAKGYWTSPGGKTPSSTLYASILRELKLRGAQARFQKTERGRFALNVPA